MVAEGASANMATLAGAAVGQMEGKTTIPLCMVATVMCHAGLVALLIS